MYHREVFAIFSHFMIVWSATEGWISVTENIATSNPLQERRAGMKTGSPARPLKEKPSFTAFFFSLFF